MNALGIDCCTETCSVAACLPSATGWRVWWRTLHSPGQQLASLAPMLQQLLTHPDLARVEWQRVGVTRGPGTFTGVRIGLTTARTLAQVRGLDVVAVDTLDTIACNRFRIFDLNDEVESAIFDPRETAAKVTVALDARKGEVFVSHYDSEACDRWPHPTWGPQAMRPTELEADVVLGTGRRLLADPPSPAADWWPSAAHLAVAAAGGYRDVPEAQTWPDVSAFYLRGADAAIPSFMRVTGG